MNTHIFSLFKNKGGGLISVFNNSLRGKTLIKLILDEIIIADQLPETGDLSDIHEVDTDLHIIDDNDDSNADNDESGIYHIDSGDLSDIHEVDTDLHIIDDNDDSNPDNDESGIDTLVIHMRWTVTLIFILLMTIKIAMRITMNQVCHM